MATDFHRIHTKFYPQLLGTYPQCCGKLYPQLLKLIHSAVENSKLFPQFIHYLWKTILATEYVPLAQLSHEGNIKKKAATRCMPVCSLAHEGNIKTACDNF